MTKIIRSVSTPEKWLPGPVSSFALPAIFCRTRNLIHQLVTVSDSAAHAGPQRLPGHTQWGGRFRCRDSCRSYQCHSPAQRNLTRIVAGGESAGRGKRGPSPAGRQGRRRVLPEGGRHQCHTIPSPSRPPPPPPSTRAFLSQLPRADVLDSTDASRDPPHAPAAPRRPHRGGWLSSASSLLSRAGTTAHAAPADEINIMLFTTLLSAQIAICAGMVEPGNLRLHKSLCTCHSAICTDSRVVKGIIFMSSDSRL